MLSAFVALGTLAGIAFSLALLFLPTLVAKSRRHPNLLAIFLVNLFFGWTFIGWVVALVWACTRPAPPVYYAPVYPMVIVPSSSSGGYEFRRIYLSPAFAVPWGEVTGARLAVFSSIISAPSGSGKSTLVNQVRSDVSGLDFSISYTTREPRGSEQQGREYHYIDRPTFERMQRRMSFSSRRMSSATCTARRAMRLPTRRNTATICCSTSTCRAQPRCGGRCRSRSTSLSCHPRRRCWRPGCATAAGQRAASRKR